MGLTKGAQTVDKMVGRNIIVSAGVGRTNAEEIKWLTQTVLASAAAWKNTGWAYVADCSKMDPVGPEEAAVLVEMTKAFVNAGCKAFGFAEGSSVMLQIQAKKNTQMSNTGIPEGHFATVDDAVAWIKEAVNI
jgi:hypothetical protein